MKKIYSFLGISFLSIIAFGQHSGETTGLCGQHIVHNKMMTDPAYAAQFNAARMQMDEHQEEMKNSAPVRGVIYKIPVVFHVLHLGGEENISREQIMDALAILNRDYRLQNADATAVHDDFKASNPSATCIPTDVEIEFVLATKAPDGSCFGGITRTYSAMTTAEYDSEGQYSAAAYGNDVYQGEWPSDKYLNIIIGKFVGTGAAAYTYLPWGGSTPYNCIFSMHDYVGSIGTSEVGKSRVLTHEVGHWLNLSHIWGDGEMGTECGDDDVPDTPETRGTNVCNKNENFCGPRANVENYMDYSYCSKMFSGGQAERMRAAVTSNISDRNNLITPSNLSEVGADGTAGLCAAKFYASRTAICVGGQVSFTDDSYNVVTGRTWTFTGGTPSASTDQNPVVTYNTPGTYAVKLVATDGSSSDTEEIANYITVFPAAATLPFLESFESLSSLSPKWSITNPGGNGTWQLATNTGSSGTKSARLGNYSEETGSIDELIATPVDLSNVNSTDKVTLSFRYAYRRTDESNVDFLKVLISSNCGESWEVRRTMSAQQLSDNFITSNWTPVAADFETVHMTNVTSGYWVENFRYKFQFIGGGGNNIYLDDINIYEGAPSGTVVVGLDEIAEFDNAVVFPNPADEQVSVRFNVSGSQKVTVSITDLTGKILQEQVINAAEGSNLVLLSTGQLSAGMYHIRFNNSGQILNFVVK